MPNVAEYADPQRLVSLAQEAEAAEWDGFYLWDHVLYHDPVVPVVDPWVSLAAVAAATTRLRIGILMVGLARRRPWNVAREGATLDHLSGGRFTFGAALGSNPGEFSRFGEDAGPRVRAEKLDEALLVVSEAWTGRPLDFEGRHFRLHDVTLQPRPVQQPRIPIWIGGKWPNRAPFVRAARWDGVMPTHVSYGHGETMPPDELRACVDFIRSVRGPDPFDVALEGASPGSGTSGRRIVSPYVEAGLSWWVEKLGWWRGSVADTVARIREGPPR